MKTEDGYLKDPKQKIMGFTRKIINIDPKIEIFQKQNNAVHLVGSEKGVSCTINF